MQNFETKLESIVKSINNKCDEAYDYIQKIQDEESTLSSKLGPKVAELIDKGKPTQALRIYNVALYRLQEVSSRFQLKYTPNKIQYNTLAKTLQLEAYASIRGDDDIVQLHKSNASLERYAENKCVKIDIRIMQIIAASNQIESAADFITSQLYAFNHILTSIKVSEALSRNEMYNDSLSDNIVMLNKTK